MTFIRMLSDPGMNYTLNRPLLDGSSPSRLIDVGAIAPSIVDYASWHTAWLSLARTAEQEERWLDAASYYHGAEFYLPAGEQRDSLYDDFARNWAKGIEGTAGYSRIEIPYGSGFLPGFRIEAEGKQRGTFIFHGGYDSFVEEFYDFLAPLSRLGFTVIAFDGPGQGGALRQKIFLDHEWEHPAAAVLDHFDLDSVSWLGASCGGYMAMRAAAYEPRISHVVAMPATYWGLDMTLNQMRPGKARQLVSLFRDGDREAVEQLVSDERLPSSVFDWCVTQGMHITGTTTPFDFLTAIDKSSLDGVLPRVKQHVLLTEGEQDHLFSPGLTHRVAQELVCAESVTTRTFTAREQGEQHCQVGNSALARTEIVNWLGGFFTDLPRA